MADKEEIERKQALLAESLSERRDTHLQRLLNAYALGDQVRAQVADNIVAEFRPVLRANGPNYDGPLYARIVEALIAAEMHGETQLRTARAEGRTSE